MLGIEKARESLERDYNIVLQSDLNTPVDVTFDHLKNSRIIFKEDVWAMIQNIALTTQVDEKELGFIMYGKEFLPNQVYFNDIKLSTAPLKSIETVFDEELTRELYTRIDENLDERFVVCHGHSHPKISSEYDNFSLGDLAGYIEFTYQVPDFMKKNVQLVGCLVLTDLPVKFVYYNPADTKFYDFQSVEIENENS